MVSVSSSCLMEVLWRALAGKCWQCGTSADSHHPTTPAQTSPQIMSQYTNNTSNIPCQHKANQKKRSNYPFLVSNSYLHPFGSCCPCPTAWDCKEAKFNMASGHPTPRVPRWATHSFGVEVLLGKRRGSPNHGAESMAKAVMQNMEVSFLLGTNIEQT